MSCQQGILSAFQHQRVGFIQAQVGKLSGFKEVCMKLLLAIISNIFANKLYEAIM